MTLAALLALKVGLTAHSREAVYYLGQADGLAWGWIAWQWYRDGVPSRTMWAAVVVGVLGFASGPFVALTSIAWSCFTVSTSAGVGAAGLVVLAARGELRDVRPLQVVSRYSYGIYLLHMPALALCGDPLMALVLTGAAAWTSLHILERPAGRWVRGHASARPACSYRSNPRAHRAQRRRHADL